MKQVFVAGGTGYIGTRLIKKLLANGHTVTALARAGSEKKVPPGANVLVANPFKSETFADYIPRNAVFIQLLGVAHPSPRKHAQFISIDLKSAEASLQAAKSAAISHFIYVSVAMEPSSIMHAYQEVRKKAEALCLQSNIPSTIIRPWYVLGPGHYWPILLLPLYGIARLIPSFRKKATAFGLVTMRQMVQTLAASVSAEPAACRILEITDIRNLSGTTLIDELV
jgi:uncharacterized protein YbjT (DUF2867 family)